MLKNFILGLVCLATLAACSKTKNNAGATNDGKHFGTMVTEKGAMPVEKGLEKMASVDSLNMKLTGKVGEVCQKKGCWMTISSDKMTGEPMRVTFKDYAFFMPKDLSGKNVVVDGFAIVTTTPVDVLRHYAEDAGKSKAEIEAITQPKREVSFEAAGVLILN